MRDYFDRELTAVNDLITDMGSMVEGAIKNAAAMILSGNISQLEEIRHNECKVNEAEKRIQDRCMAILLHQAPVASDLRYVSAALKMITDLERIGDQAADIAEMGKYVKNDVNVLNMTHIATMACESAKMVTDSIDAFVKKDLQLARDVSRRDDVIDGLFDKLREETVEIISRDKKLGVQAIDIVMIAKYLERIGDHAVNVAEWAAFSLTGSTKL